MGVAIAFYLLLLGAAIVIAVYREYARGESELVSCRNIAIGGFLYFQVWAGVPPLATGNTMFYRTDHLTMDGLIYAGMATVFALVFWYTYKFGWGARQLATKVPLFSFQPSEPMLWAVACALPVLAAACRFSVEIPLIGVLTMYAGNSFAAMSAGIAGWIWAKRMFNPIAAAAALSLFVTNSFIVTIGEFGRRPLVGVALAMLWGMYFSTWRHQRLVQWMPRLIVIGSLGALMVISYSSVRSTHDVTRSFDFLYRTLMSKSDVAGESVGLLFPDTGPIGLWLIESHPERFEPKPLFTLYYTFLNPVPRAWWPEKPDPLGLRLARMAGLRNVSDEMNLGPGIIGHAASEGGWYALVIYAFCGALLLRFFDTLVARGIRNPLIMLPLGSTLGQVLALARGESSVFTWIFVYGTTTTFGATILLVWLSRLVGIGGGAPPLEAEEAFDYAPEDDDLHEDVVEYDNQWSADYGEGPSQERV